MDNLSDDKYCFVCGEANPQGFRLKFEFDKSHRRAESVVIFRREFQGWSGIVHGGLIATVLDEVMVKATECEGMQCVTAELKIKYRKPVQVLKEYRLQAEIESADKRIVLTTAQLLDPAGILMAEAQGKLFKM